MASAEMATCRTCKTVAEGEARQHAALDTLVCAAKAVGAGLTVACAAPSTVRDVSLVALTIQMLMSWCLWELCRVAARLMRQHWLAARLLGQWRVAAMLLGQ